MSEQDLRDGLWAAVADEPALAFDPDAVISKARQDVRRRRALVGAGAATAAVAVAAVAVPTMIGSPRGWFGGAGPGQGDGAGCASFLPSVEPPSMTVLPTFPPGPSYSEFPLPELSVPSAPPGSADKPTVPAPGAEPTFSMVPMPTASYPPPGPDVPKPPAHPCPPSFDQPPSSGLPVPGEPEINFQWPPADVKPANHSAEQLRQRGAEMQAYLKERFATIVPGATNLNVGPFGGDAAGMIADGQQHLAGITGFTLNNERSAVDIYVAAPGAKDVPPPMEACSPGCKVVHDGPDGSLVTMRTEDLGNGAQAMTVTNYRSNGTVVTATGYNYDPTLSVMPTYLPTIPVNAKQLTMLATDPKLTL